jgi:hypothetical protein
VSRGRHGAGPSHRSWSGQPMGWLVSGEPPRLGSGHRRTTPGA